MTTIAELLEQTPLRVESGIDLIANWDFNHIPELEERNISRLYDLDDVCEDIEVVVFHDQYWTVTKGQRLIGVRFRGQWVMLCSNAGSRYAQYSHKQILNIQAYRDLVSYIHGEIVKLPVEMKSTEQTPLDKEVKFEFFGHDVRHKYYRDF